MSSISRSESFKPIDSPKEPKTRSRLYDMHSYWSKKPYTVTSEYIRHFTDENDIVLDPFCGCGVTNIEALRLGRKTVAIDINPLAIFIARGMSKPIKLANMEKAFRTIRRKVRKKVNALYEIDCPKCRNKAIAKYFVWDNNEPSEAVYECPFCKARGETTKVDLRSIKKIEKRKVPFW